MAEQETLWPDYFPPCCPPGDAASAAGSVFRVVEQVPAQPGDAQPHLVRYPNRRFADRCLACGLSVYRRLEDVQRLQRRVPALASKPVVRIELGETMGVLQPTPHKALPDSHHTWWVPDAVEVWREFRPIEGDGGG